MVSATIHDLIQVNTNKLLPVSDFSFSIFQATDIQSSSSANESKEEENTNSNVDDVDDITELRKMRLSSYINKYMKIEMTDGRILIGTFVCTDKDANVILSACSEFFNTESTYCFMFL